MSVRKGQNGIKQPFSKNKGYRRSCKANLSYRKYIFYAYAFYERDTGIALCLKKCVYNSPFRAYMDEFIPYIKISVLYVSDEIDAGTIRWSQELRRIGVKHPDYWRAYARAKAEIIVRYEPYLFAYAAHRKCPYERDPKQKGWGMIEVEWQMVACVERDIEGQYGADIAALLGILKAEIGTDDILEDLEKRHPSRSERHKPFTRPTPDQRFHETVEWFVQGFTHEPVSGNPIRCSQEEYLETLHALYQRWDRLPVVHPLVLEPNEPAPAGL